MGASGPRTAGGNEGGGGAVDRRRAWLVLSSMAATFVVMRSALALRPNADFDLGGYNIHHLFVGLVLIVLGGVPLALIPARARWTDGASLIFGSGLALALDEWVYLIATDGSNASYLLPISFWGGAVAVAAGCAYIALLMRLGPRPPEEHGWRREP